jgi:hypothetical protein
LVGITSPDHLRLQVFSTSWRFDPPHACWPCFMPDPLMGFALQSFPPPAQPFAVSSAVSLLPFKTPATPPECQPSPQTPKRRAKNSLPYWEGPRSAPRLQGFAPRESPPLHLGCLGRNEHVALLGFLLSRAFTLGGMATAFTAPPLMRSCCRATNRPSAPSSGFHFHTRSAYLSRDCLPS